MKRSMFSAKTWGSGSTSIESIGLRAGTAPLAEPGFGTPPFPSSPWQDWQTRAKRSPPCFTFPIMEAARAAGPTSGPGEGMVAPPGAAWLAGAEAVSAGACDLDDVMVADESLPADWPGAVAPLSAPRLMR